MMGNGAAEPLETLAGHKQVRVRVSVASNPTAAPQLLARLAADSSCSVRRVVAARADTPADALHALVNDGDRQTRQALATNPNCPLHALVALLADAHWSVRWAVMDSAAADVTIRRAICQSDDADMRAILAHRPGLEDEINALLQADASTEVRATLAEHTDNRAVLAAPLDDPEPRVRAAAGMNTHTTVEQRRRLVHDPAWQVRNSVVSSKDYHGWQIPEEDLLLLAQDRSVNVRYWLANMPGATRRVYEVLADDSDQLVADTAALWLLPSDHPQHPNNRPTLDEQTLDSVGLTTIHPEHTWGPGYLGSRTPHAELPRPPSTHTPWSAPAPE